MDKKICLGILIVAVLAVLIVMGLKYWPQSFAAGNPQAPADLVLSVWWAAPESLPSWAAYKFNALDSRTIPALCSCVARIRISGHTQLAAFIGTGKEHPNRLLYADPSGTNLVDAAFISGLQVADSYMGAPLVYACLSFDPWGRGYDDLLLGTSTGLWHLQASGVTNTSYKPALLASNPGPDNANTIPIAFSVSTPIQTPNASSQYIDVGSGTAAQIWSSFYSAPSLLRAKTGGAGDSPAAYFVPTVNSPNAILNISGKRYYGNVGRFGSTAPGTLELGRTLSYTYMNYSWTAAGAAPIAVSLQSYGALTPKLTLNDAAFSPDTYLGTPPTTSITDRNTIGDSVHVLNRTGPIDSDGLARPAERSNDLTQRQEKATTTRLIDRAGAAAASASLVRPVIMHSTPFNNLESGAPQATALLAYLSGRRKTIKMSVSAPALVAKLGGVPVNLGRSSDSRAVGQLGSRDAIVRVTTGRDEWRQKPTLILGPYTIALDALGDDLLTRPTIALV